MAESQSVKSVNSIRRQVRRLPSIVLFLLILPVMIAGCMMTQPIVGKGKRSAATVDPQMLRKCVETICSDFTPRSYLDATNLNRCADWIEQSFREAGGRTSNQVYTAAGRKFRNVIARFGLEQGPLVVVGAHYDSFGRMPAADDNASGVAGLIELARLFSRNTPQIPVEVVAYSNEEPPFFASSDMGSAHHARGVKAAGVDVRAVIVLEMIGYFSDEPKSQSYPMALLRLFYPNKGNYIAVVGSFGQTRLVRRIKWAMRGATDLPVHSINAPAIVPGVDFSDHRSYWDVGFAAVMVTDTAFYRNRDYHTANDTPNRLDYNRMAKVVMGVYEAVLAIGL